MRHLPSIGAIPAPGTAELFMVIKQDIRGTCFVITGAPMDWLLELQPPYPCPRSRHRRWEHTTRSDLRDADFQAESVTAHGNRDEPPF